MNTINRALLRRSLNLPDRLPLDYHGIYPNHSVPLGHRWIQPNPPSYVGTYTVPESYMTATVVIRQSRSFIRDGRRVKVSAHRIYIICPRCHEAIPAGRWHQHEGSRKCHLASHDCTPRPTANSTTESVNSV